MPNNYKPGLCPGGCGTKLNNSNREVRIIGYRKKEDGITNEIIHCDVCSDCAKKIDNKEKEIIDNCEINLFGEKNNK